jgi:hypothetical protein
MHRAAAPWPPTLMRQPGGYDKIFSTRPAPTDVARGENSPRVVLGRRRWPEGSA